MIRLKCNNCDNPEPTLDQSVLKYLVLVKIY